MDALACESVPPPARPSCPPATPPERCRHARHMHMLDEAGTFGSGLH